MSPLLQHPRRKLSTHIINSMDRLHFLPMLNKRWKGYTFDSWITWRHYSIALFVQPNEVETAISLIKELSPSDKYRIILYIPQEGRDPPGVYPINKLRNIAIVNIITSHFLVMDMDMWPACMIDWMIWLLATLYDELLQLPQPLLKSSNSSVIVPAFFVNPDYVLPYCKDILSCAKVYLRTILIKP